MNFQDSNIESAIKQHCEEMISIVAESQRVLTDSGKRTFDKLTEQTNMPEVLSVETIGVFNMAILGSSQKGLTYLFDTTQEAWETAHKIFNNPSLFQRDYILIHGCFSLLLMALEEFYRSFPNKEQPYLSDLLSMDKRAHMLCMWVVEVAAYLPGKVNEFRRQDRSKTTRRDNAEVKMWRNVQIELKKIGKEIPDKKFSLNGIANTLGEALREGGFEVSSKTLSELLKRHIPDRMPHEKRTIAEWIEAIPKVGKV